MRRLFFRIVEEHNRPAQAAPTPASAELEAVPSNHNYVCFDCRVAVRRAKTIATLPPCSQCGGQSTDLGYKIALPQKGDADAWEQLRIEQRETRRRNVQLQTETQVARIHDLERQITRLEGLPENPGRARTIRELRKQLSDV
jgi:hypothetical protein